VAGEGEKEEGVITTLAAERRQFSANLAAMTMRALDEATTRVRELDEEGRSGL
jgi:hypothetical protein